MEELENGFKDKGINGKSIAMTAGDEAKANSIYIELRAKMLQDEYIQELQEKELQKRELQKKEFKEIEEDGEYGELNARWGRKIRECK